MTMSGQWEGEYLESIVLHKPREMEEGSIHIALCAGESSMPGTKVSTCSKRMPLVILEKSYFQWWPWAVE